LAAYDGILRIVVWVRQTNETVCLFENVETPITMPRPIALIGITVTVRTMQISNDRLHKLDDKNKTLNEKKRKCMQVVWTRWH